MLTHTIKLFFRNLFRNKTYTLINILGLSIAFACSFLILLFLIHEVGYDTYHKNRNRIFRILTQFDMGVGPEVYSKSNSFLVKEALVNDFPEIEKASRIYNYGNHGDKQLVKVGVDFIEEKSIKMVDNEFFDIFTIEIISGPKTNPLETQQSILISESAVKKYFGNNDPIGKILFIKNNWDEVNFEVVGIFKDIPTNSTFRAEIIGNIKFVENRYLDRGWRMSNIETYFLLNNNTDINSFNKKLKVFGQKHHKELDIEYSSQSLNDIYFKSGHLNWYDMPQGNVKHIVLFSIIAVLIVLIASINYIILSTAKGIGRSLEIGIRKVIGASKISILLLVILESIMFMFIILPSSLIFSELFLPTLNRLLGREMVVDYLDNWVYLLCLIGVILFVGIISGLYISLYLSRFQPEDILKHKYTTKYGRNYLRKGLLTIQLIVFIVLFIFSSVIYTQLKYVQNKDLGYSSDHILIVNPPHLHDLTDATPFVDMVKKLPDIESVSQVSAGINTPIVITQNFINPAKPNDTILVRLLTVDNEYNNVFHLRFISGNWFTENSMNNTIVINETAAKKFGFDISKDMYVSAEGLNFKVVGIIKDINIGSLHENIEPLGIKIRGNTMMSQIAVRYKSVSNTKNLLKVLENYWNDLGPKSYFDYYFWEDQLKSQYKDDKNFGDTISLFAILTIIIALLGLFGLSLFTAQQRNKEIGIRKVYGASNRSILHLFLKENIYIIIYQIS